LGHRNGVLTWIELQELLTLEGEKIDKGDLETYLSALLGDAVSTLRNNEPIDGAMFPSRFLGFEETN
jgi:hypothetical protein